MPLVYLELPTLVQHAPDLDVSLCSWNISILTRAQSNLSLYRVAEDIITPLDATLDEVHPCRSTSGGSSIAEPRIFSFNLPATTSFKINSTLPIVIRILLMKREAPVTSEVSSSSSLINSPMMSVISEFEEEINLGSQPFACGLAGKLLIQFKNRKQDPHSVILVAEFGLTFEPFHSRYHPLVLAAKPLSLSVNSHLRLEESRRVNISLNGFNIVSRESAVIAADGLLFPSMTSAATIPSQGRTPSQVAVLTILGDPLRRLEVLCALSRASGEIVCDPVSLGFTSVSESCSTAVFGSTSGAFSENNRSTASGWSIELATSVTLTIPLSSARLMTKNSMTSHVRQVMNSQETSSDIDLEFEDDYKSPADAHKDVSDVHLLFYVLSHPSVSAGRKETQIAKRNSTSKKPTCVAFSYLRLFDDKGHFLCDPKSESPLNEVQMSSQSKQPHIVTCGDGSVGIFAPLVLYPGSPPFLPADPKVSNEAVFIPSQASRLVTSEVDLPQSLHYLRTSARVPPHLRLLEANASALFPFILENKTLSAKQSASMGTSTPYISSTLQQVQVDDVPRAQALGIFPSVMNISIIIADNLPSGSCVGDATLRKILAASYAAEVEDKALALSSPLTPSHVVSVRGKAFTPQNLRSKEGLTISNAVFAANMNLRALIASLSSDSMISCLRPGQIEASLHGWKAISCVIRVHLAAIVALRTFENRKQTHRAERAPLLASENQNEFEQAALTGILPGTEEEEGDYSERDSQIFKKLMTSIGVPLMHLPLMCSRTSNLSTESSMSLDEPSSVQDDNGDKEDDVFAEKQAEVAAGGLRILLRIISSSLLCGEKDNTKRHSLSFYCEKRIFGQVLLSSPLVNESRGLFEAGCLPPGPFSTCLLMCRISVSSMLSFIKSSDQQLEQHISSLSDWLLDWAGFVCSALLHAMRTGQLLSIRIDENVVAAAAALNPLYLYPTRRIIQCECLVKSDDSSLTSVSPFLHAIHSFRSLLLLVLDSLVTITDVPHTILEKYRFFDTLALITQLISTTATFERSDGSSMKSLSSTFPWINELLSRIISLLVLHSSDSSSQLNAGLSLNKEKRSQKRVLTSMTTPKQQLDVTGLKTPMAGRATMSIIDKYRMTTGRPSLTSSMATEFNFSSQNDNGKKSSMVNTATFISDSTTVSLISRRLRATSNGQTSSGSLLVTAPSRHFLNSSVSIPIKTSQILSESLAFQSSNNLMSESVAISCPQSMLKDVLTLNSDVDHLSLYVRASLLDMCSNFFMLVSANYSTNLRVISSITVQHLACYVAAEISRSETALIKSLTIACTSFCSLIERRGCVPGTEYVLDSLFMSSAVASVDAVKSLSATFAARSSRFLLLALRVSRAFSISSLEMINTSDYNKRCLSRAVQFVLPSVGSRKTASLAMSAASLRCIQGLILKSAGSWTVRSRWPTILRSALLQGSRSRAEREDDAEDSPADGFSCMMWAIRDSCLLLRDSDPVNADTHTNEDSENEFPIPALSSAMNDLVSKPLLHSVLPIIAFIESKDSFIISSDANMKDEPESGPTKNVHVFDTFLVTLKNACKAVTSVPFEESKTMISNINDNVLSESFQPSVQEQSLLSSLLSALISSLSRTSSESTDGVTSTIDSLWQAVTSAMVSAVSFVGKSACLSNDKDSTNTPHHQDIIPTSLLLESIRLLTTITCALLGRAFFEGERVNKRHQKRFFRQSTDHSSAWNPQSATTFLSQCLISLRDAEGLLEEKRPDYADCCDTLLLGKRNMDVEEAPAQTKATHSKRAAVPPFIPTTDAVRSPRKSYIIVSTIISRVAINWSGSLFVSIFSREGTDALDRLHRQRNRRSSSFFSFSGKQNLLIQGDEEDTSLVAAITLSSAASYFLFRDSDTGEGRNTSVTSISTNLLCLASSHVILSEKSMSTLRTALNIMLSKSIFPSLQVAEAVRDLHNTAVTFKDVSSAYGFASLAVAVCGDAKDIKPDHIGTQNPERMFLSPNGLAWPHSIHSPGAADHASCASDSLHAPVDSLPLAHTLAQKARVLVEIVRAEEVESRYSPVSTISQISSAGRDDTPFHFSRRPFFCIDYNQPIHLFPSLSLSKSSSLPPKPQTQLLSSKKLILLSTARELHTSFAVAFGACLAAREYELALDITSALYSELVRVLNRMQVNEADSADFARFSSSISLITLDHTANVNDDVKINMGRKHANPPRVSFNIANIDDDDEKDDDAYGESLHPSQRTNRAGTIKMITDPRFISGIAHSRDQHLPELAGEAAIVARAIGLLLRDCAAGGEAAAHFVHGSLPTESIRSSWESILATSLPSSRGRKARLSAGPGKHSFCASLLSFAFTLRNGLPPILKPVYAAVGFCVDSNAQYNQVINRVKENISSHISVTASLRTPPHVEWRLTRLPVDTSVSDFAAEVQKIHPEASVFGPDSVFLLDRDVNASLSLCGTGIVASNYLAKVRNHQEFPSKASLKSIFHIYILPAFPSQTSSGDDDDDDKKTDQLDLASTTSTFESLSSQLPITTPLQKGGKRGEIYSSSLCKVYKAPVSRRSILSSASLNDVVRPGSGVLLHSGGFKLHAVKPDELAESGQSSGLAYLQLTLNHSQHSEVPYFNLLPWTTRLARIIDPPRVIETSLISACEEWATAAKERLQSRINWTSSVYLESCLPASSTAPAPPIFAPAPTSASLALALLPPSLPETGMPDDSFFDTHYEKGGQGCGSLPTPLVQALLSGRYSLDLNPAPISVPTKVSAQLVSATLQRQNVFSHLSKRSASKIENNKGLSVLSGNEINLSIHTATSQKAAGHSSVIENVQQSKDVAQGYVGKGDQVDEKQAIKGLDENDKDSETQDGLEEGEEEKDEDDGVSSEKRPSSIRSKTSKNDINKGEEKEDKEEELADGAQISMKAAEGGLDGEVRSDFTRSGRSRTASSLNLSLPFFGGLGTVSVSSSFLSDTGERGWRDRTHSLSSVASSQETDTIASLYDESDDENEYKDDVHSKTGEHSLVTLQPHVPFRLYRLPRLSLSQTFALLLDDLTTGMPPHTSTGSRRSGGLPVASLVISPQRQEYSDVSNVLLLIEMGKRACLNRGEKSILIKSTTRKRKGEEKQARITEGDEINSTLILSTRSDYRPGLDASSVIVRLRGIAGIAAVPIFPPILPPQTLPKLPPFPEQIFPSPEEGGAPVGQAIVPSWLASLVLSAGVADTVHPAWSSICGLQISRQALSDYSELKVIEREKATTELRREFCRWEESERAAGRGDDVDAYPIPDWPNAIPKGVHASIPLLEAEVNQAMAAAAVTSMFVLPNIAATLAGPATGSNNAASAQGGGTAVKAAAAAAAVASASSLNSSVARVGDENLQHQHVHRAVLTGVTRICADFDGIFSRVG